MTRQPDAPLEISDYLAILRRRRTALLLPFTLIVLAAVALAALLPPVYRAAATILVERQEIPQDLVATTVTGYVQERIQSLTQRLLTAETVRRIADTIGYTALLDKDELVPAMRQGVTVEMVDVQTNAGGNHLALATVAFTVAFEAPTPELARDGANAFADLYLQEERRARRAQTREVTRFLEAESQRLADQIGELERRLALFKQDNVERLPEQTDLNLRLLEQTADKIERAQEQIGALQDRQMRIAAQLAITRPTAPLVSEEGTRVLTAGERLSLLRGEYAKAMVKYSADHPDVARLRREIALLEQQPGSAVGAVGPMAELERVQAELADARRRYSEEHPDVRRLSGQAAALREQLRGNARQSATRAEPEMVVADNPAYVQLRSELDTVGANLGAERQKLTQLERRHAELEARLVQTPEVEREYRGLSRDWDNAVQRYRETREKLAQAQAAEQLEQSERAQHFALVEQAFAPRTPQRPNRLGIILLGLVLAVGGGLGGVAGAEVLDRSVRGSRDVRWVLGGPPLATIPVIRVGKVQRPWLSFRNRSLPPSFPPGLPPRKRGD